MHKKQLGMQNIKGIVQYVQYIYLFLYTSEVMSNTQWRFFLQIKWKIIYQRDFFYN